MHIFLKKAIKHQKQKRANWEWLTMKRERGCVYTTNLDETLSWSKSGC